MIQHPAGIAVDNATRKLDCTVRTIWRDLSALQKAGFPLYDDKDAAGRRSLWKLEEPACRSSSRWPGPPN